MQYEQKCATTGKEWDGIGEKGRREEGNNWSYYTWSLTDQDQEEKWQILYTIHIQIKWQMLYTKEQMTSKDVYKEY